jgi:alpha-L-arabinofuranosidase
MFQHSNEQTEIRGNEINGRQAGGRRMIKNVKYVVLAGVGLASAYTAFAQITVREPIPAVAQIKVDAAAMGPEIPKTIFGTFLEPIGNSTYNGLWSELLRNPSFEAGLWNPAAENRMLRDEPELTRASHLALPLPWEPLDEHQGNRYEIVYGHAANSWQSLRVFALPGQATGIRQMAYLPIQRTRSYAGSFYARHLSGAADVTLELRPHNQPEALASQNVQVSAAVWTRYTIKFEVPEGKLKPLDAVDFVVKLAGDERIELDEFSLMPADATGGLDPDVVKLAREMKTPLVRLGGNFTSSYHWRDGIGPRDKRISMLNNSWGIPEYNTFGTDEFLEFCRRIGAEPQIAVNMGSGTPEEAAAWVRYVDQHWTQHSGLLWELGNELWGDWNLGYPAKSELAARTLAFSKAIRQVDPSARLIATGADMDGFREWNGIQLTNPPGTFNYLSTHFVVGTGDVLLKDPAPEFVNEASYALPVELERKLRDAQNQIDNVPGYKDKVHLAFTEWLWTGGRPNAPNFVNTGGAITTGAFLNMMMRSSSIVPISDMTGIMEFAGIWKAKGQVFATPSYYVFKMYSSAASAKLVDVTVDSGLYSVAQGVKRLPNIENVPYLDVVAAVSQNGGRLTLFCVNRSVSSDITAHIALDHFAAASTASVQTLSSASLTDRNDETAPTRVIPAASTEQLPNGNWTHVFPHASVTAISIDRR